MNNHEITQIKSDLIHLLETTPALAVVGRVKDWLYDPECRYPISCTVFSVEDSMEDENGIEDSWLFVSKGLRFGAGVALDLSKIRPMGSDNGRGLVASGPVSFMKIYSALNEVLRRGGKFKNGAVVTYLDAQHKDLHEFLSIKPSDIPWIKRALYVDDNPDSPDYILNHPKLDTILDAVRTGTLWLAKKRWFHPTSRKTVNYPPVPTKPDAHRLYSQVCLEILLPSNCTCILTHINLGRCTLDNMVSMFITGMYFLCQLHRISGAGRGNYYLSPEVDKQVGLGVLGLANFLAIQGITYAEFTHCLEDYLNLGANCTDDEMRLYESRHKSQVVRVVMTLCQAFQAAAKVARDHRMDRAFTIAPTASCAFRYTDLEGYVTTQEISPPICHPITKRTIRDSGTFGQTEVQYHPNVETAAQVGWETYYRLAKAWQKRMDSTGLAHSISFNIWNQCPVDREWFADWLASPLVTTYYRMMVEQEYVDKSTINAGLNEAVFDESDDFFIPAEVTEELEPLQLSLFPSFSPETKGDAGFCSINGNVDEDCSACRE